MYTGHPGPRLFETFEVFPRDYRRNSRLRGLVNATYGLEAAMCLIIKAESGQDFKEGPSLGACPVPDPILPSWIVKAIGRGFTLGGATG